MTRTAIFAAVKAARDNRAFTAPEVAALDAALDALGVPKDGAAAVGMTISAKGLALIKEFEGLRLKAYPDPGSGGAPWTIGIGTTVYPDGRKVKPGDVVTEAQAEDYLRHDIAAFEDKVRKFTGGVATQGQHDALTSFAYNLGPENLRNSTLLKKHNAGDYAGAAGEFAKWNRAAGKVMAGLTRRRAAEAALYRS